MPLLGLLFPRRYKLALVARVAASPKLIVFGGYDGWKTLKFKFPPMAVYVSISRKGGRDFSSRIDAPLLAVYLGFERV